MSRGARIRIGALLVLAGLVPACGGGGGGGGGTVGGGAGDPGVVEFISAVFSGTEGDGVITVTVSRSGSSGPASVGYATSDGTALDGLDYTATSGTLSWADGVGGDQSFDVPIEDADGFLEGTEAFNVALSLPTGASLGAVAMAGVSIIDLDAPAEGIFQFDVATYTVVEGDATVQATITVERSGGTAGTATVDVAATPGSTDPAATPADWVVTGGTNTVTLTFNDGETSKSITIDIAADTDVEAVETIALTLQNPTPTPDGAEIGTLGTAVVRIVDIDAAGTVELSGLNFNVFENAGSVIVTVTRSGGAAAASVDLQVAGGASPLATAGSDYTAPATLPVPLTWAAGDITPQTVEIFITNDSDLEGDETINLSLINESGAALGAVPTGTVTLIDDETGTVQFSSALVTVTEGNIGTSTDVTVTVTRSPGSTGAADVTVNISPGAGASYPGDFSAPDPAAPIALHWDAGDLTSRNITFTIVGDDTFEQDEFINLTLSGPSGAGLGVPSASSVKIIEDDLPPNGAVQFVASTLTVNESDGTATLMVRRMGGTVGTLSFAWQTFNGTARGNGKQSRRDFTAVPLTTVTWNDGENADQPLTITIRDNDDLDSNDVASETFRVRLSSVSGSLILPPATGQITILDD